MESTSVKNGHSPIGITLTQANSGLKHLPRRLRRRIFGLKLLDSADAPSRSSILSKLLIMPNLACRDDPPSRFGSASIARRLSQARCALGLDRAAMSRGVNRSQMSREALGSGRHATARWSAPHLLPALCSRNHRCRRRSSKLSPSEYGARSRRNSSSSSRFWVRAALRLKSLRPTPNGSTIVLASLDRRGISIPRASPKLSSV